MTGLRKFKALDPARHNPAVGMYQPNGSMNGRKLMQKTKQPYVIGLKDGSMFAFAGLLDSWKDKETGKALETYTVITTDPNDLMEPIHNRMPVILHRQDYDRWLAVADPAQMPLDLLRPYPAKEMKAWKVSRAVGNTRNNDASLILPV